MISKYNTQRHGNLITIFRIITAFTLIMLSILIYSCVGNVLIKRINQIKENPLEWERYFSDGDTYFAKSWSGDKIDEFYVPNIDWQNKRFVLNIFAIEWDEIPDSWAEEIVEEFCQQFEQIASVKIEYKKSETEVGNLPSIKDTKWKFPYGLNMSSIKYKYDTDGANVVEKSTINSDIKELKDIVEVQVYLPIFTFDQQENKKVISYFANVVFLDVERYLYKRNVSSNNVILPHYSSYIADKKDWDKGTRRVSGLKHLLINDLNMQDREVKKIISDLKNKLGKEVDKKYTFPDKTERDEAIERYGDFYDIRINCYTSILSKRLINSKDSYLLNIIGGQGLKPYNYLYATMEPITLMRALSYQDEGEIIFVSKEYCKEQFNVKNKESGKIEYGKHKAFSLPTQPPRWLFKGYGNSVSVLGKIHNIDELDVNSAMGVNDAFKLLAEQYKKRYEWAKEKTESVKHQASLIYFPSDKYNIDTGVAIRRFDISYGSTRGEDW